MLTVFLNQSIKPKREKPGGGKEALSPSEVLTNLFQDFNQTNFKSEVYIVMLYGILDLSRMEFTFASAGLNVPPLRINASGKLSELMIKGFPICKFPDGQNPGYIDSSYKLESGDRLFFYTDGLTEAKNGDNKSYTEARLRAQIQKSRSLDLNHFAKSITDNAFTFIGDSKLQDDITLVIMEVK
jgi:sigma-B regulation protein RsbU (phosphoserine phosphatase)